MTAKRDLEYLCPHCGHVNAIAEHAVRDMYKEQYTECVHCRQQLEIVPACGIGDQINLVVSVAAQDTPQR
ncbi:hypothetical protein OCL06_08265 [Alteromonas sp. ASW11-19]|uniref:CPXCG motif-containing cysteine-rich protein n=1 Tax=Alteromonas salexigens TaxID=2982530 RepID=A0ABT2VQR8_9ALTE|nr:hypothetical protein [Alteromonas salexigens]MCU7554591.1 hypothetical protein [Alteromonas salexigens]